MNNSPRDESNVDHRGMAWRWSGRLGALVLAGVILVFFRPILVPMVFAVLLSFLLVPLVTTLTSRGVHHGLSILFAEVLGTLPLLGLVMIFLTTAGPLTEKLPEYQDQLLSRVELIIDSALSRMEDEVRRETVRREVVQKVLPELVQEGAQIVQRSVGTVTTAFGSFFLTLILSGFMLAESRRFREKFCQAFGEDHPLLGSLEGIGRDVRRYVVAKTWISALTGIFVWVFLELCGVDFAALWGLLAFPLNFVPTVGAVVASIPPVLVALIDPELSGLALGGIILGLTLINGFIGAVLDPRYVGQAVKVSPLVVFGSMLIWGSLWGPTGMILAVPIMVSIKVVCGRIPSLEPFATLLRG